MEKKRLNIHDLVSYVKKSNIVDVHNFGDNPLGYILEKYSKILLFTLDFDVSVEVKKLRDIDYAFEMGSVFSNGREVTYCVLQNGHPLSLKMLVGCVGHPSGSDNAAIIQSLVQQYPERIELYKSSISVVLTSETTELS